MMSCVHICIVTSAHSVDDVRVSHKITQAFCKDGFRVTWVGPNFAVFPGQEYNKYGVEYRLFRSGKGKLGRIFNYFQLNWFVGRVSDVDVFYAPDPDAAELAVRMSRKFNARVVFDIHEMYHGAMLDRWIKGTPAKFIGKTLHRQLSRICMQCDLIVGVSQAVMEPYHTVSTEKMVIRSCAPSWFAKGQPADVCSSDRNQFTFLHGKANASRGTGVVLKALSLIKKQMPAVKCIMFDSFTKPGVDSSRFEQQVADLDLAAIVELRKGISIQEMPSVLQLCDAGIIAYGRELGSDSLPNKLFEYMAAGLPIIAPSYATEIRHIIEGEKCGLLVDFEDPQSVSHAMLWFLNHPKEIREMGWRARIGFIERHNWEIEVKPLIHRIRSWF
jgi:glycosyltransferase involved in cell wall biosynthesis